MSHSCWIYWSVSFSFFYFTLFSVCNFYWPIFKLIISYLCSVYGELVKTYFIFVTYFTSNISVWLLCFFLFCFWDNILTLFSLHKLRKKHTIRSKYITRHLGRCVLLPNRKLSEIYFQNWNRLVFKSTILPSCLEYTPVSAEVSVNGLNKLS